MLSQSGSTKRSPASKREITHMAQALLVAVVVLTAYACVEIYRSADRMFQYQALMDDSVATQAQLRSILMLLERAEAEQRGYQLTGIPGTLDNFQAGAQAVSEQLEELVSGSGPDTGQSRRAVELQQAAEAKLQRLGVLAESRGDLEAASLGRSVIQEDRSTARIRGLVQTMLSAEQNRIGQQSAAIREQTRSFRQVTLLMLGGVVFLLIIALALAIDYVEHRRVAETHLKAARAKAEQARAEAEQANAAKSDFLAAMSHEIRTPLTAILGYAELLQEDGVKAGYRTYIDRISAAGTSLLTVLDDVLDFSRIEARAVAIRRASLRLEPLLEEAMSFVVKPAAEKRIALHLRLDRDLPDMIVADEARLRQVLVNLLSNAVKFTEKGEITLRVDGQVAPGGDRTILFSVRDTGIGIPRDQQENIFTRFYQVESSLARRFSGSGLGLAIARGLVETMGGQIGVQSEPGKGATFRFSIPLIEAAAPEECVRPESEPQKAGSRRILLAEDMEQNQQLARTILESGGHEVELASNGSEAIAAAREKIFDLVLMDVQMPGTDGLTAAREIRRLDGPTSHVPIIALTANVLPAQIRSFHEAGMNDYLAKPYRRDLLLQKVATWLSVGSSGSSEALAAARSQARPFEGKGAADVLAFPAIPPGQNG